MITFTMRILATVAVVAAVVTGLTWTGGGPNGQAVALELGQLTEDGRIGKVTDVQGIVSIKPVMHRRWTPVTGPVILKPGDWIRTDVRGANAVTVKLAGQTDLILGPGTLVELPKPTQIKIGSGELKIAADKKTPVQLTGPDGKSVTVSEALLFRVDARTNGLVRIAKPPLWLQGFEGTTAHDSIGSLVANIDGRDTPLTVGYHKVTVDIRDQIARTVIEESFVNHTNSRTEGVFYFPLPQDASISGFGMWIGSELVEADVVEKQRAREIYETILRERRDPGLLEWTGGNLFKARVFPIEAHSEKRIKITYTQVLPLVGDRYRYSYGLQSEMLRQHPLRELAMDVKVSSVLPLDDVSSPTHLARIDKTKHAAHVEFAAQEYTPDRDFEVVVRLDADQRDAVMIPHRRGEDGYFLLSLAPPNSDGQWHRETLPDGEPLELLILADTSGSMDDSSRQNQADFLTALCGSLTEDDRINLAVCDVDCQWAFTDPQPASAEKITEATDFLADRVSLGWTDLDKAFAGALERCGPDTQVIYIGDGVVTTGDADPTAFGKRLKRLVQNRQGAFHAVSVSSSFEPIVLKTIASIGGGSVRQIGGEQTPAKVAFQLLTEMTQPVFRDLQVEFRGLTVARVYPEQLPNLSAGTQQILLGRYLPVGDDQQGEVVVTGTYDGKPVRFSTSVSLKDAESGNAFIPRLWARMHLDALLEQGSSPVIKDEIIALSEEYHIITPYTSLLVLESDEDRERFKVNRRFLMRGGEQYFAEGRDRADFELLQKQMQLAGNWRLGLRRQVLSQLMGLGRDAVTVTVGGTTLPSPGDYGGAVTGGATRWDLGRKVTFSERAKFKQAAEKVYFSEGYEDVGGYAVDALGSDMSNGYSFDPQDGIADASEILMDEDPFGDFDLDMEEDFESVSAMSRSEIAGDPEPMVDYNGRSSRELYAPMLAAAKPSRATGLGYGVADKRLSGSRFQSAYGRHEQSSDLSFIVNLFPSLAPPTAESTPVEPESWPAAARALADSLLRKQQLAELAGGLQIERERTTRDPRWDTVTSRNGWLALVSSQSWLTRSSGGWDQTQVNWCNDTRRGVYSVELQLGRTREATEKDISSLPPGLSGFVLQSLAASYEKYAVEVRPQGDERAVLVLKHPTSPGYGIRVLIDTVRHVVLRVENVQDDEVNSTIRFDGFVQVAAAWWATREETLDKEGRITAATKLKFTELEPSAFDRRVRGQLADRDRIQFWSQPVVSASEAKAAVADASDDFDDQMTLLLHYARIQDWPRVLTHLERAEQLGGGKPGMRWVRNAVLMQSRRREELRQRILAEAEQLAKKATGNACLAEHLRGQAASALEANEMLELLDVLKPVYEEQPACMEGHKLWLTGRVTYLQQTGQADQVLEVRHELAEQYPRDMRIQTQYANLLSKAGEYQAAYDWLERVVVPEAQWRTYEESTLRTTYCDLLQGEGRFPDMVEYLKDWAAQEPDDQTAYARYLSALVHSDREDDANRLITRWIRDARRPGAVDKAAVASRLNAAISQALGQGHNLYTNQIEQRWFKPLAETARFFALDESHSQVANRIMSQWNFSRSDVCRRVRTWAATLLLDKEQAVPANRMGTLVNWIISNDPEVDVRDWRRMAQVIQQRWSIEEDVAKKDMLAGPLVQILSRHMTTEEHLAFLRRQLADGPAKHHAQYAAQLFAALLGVGLPDGNWTAERENEAFGLLPQLSDAEQAAERLLAQIAALHQLTDALVQARYDVRLAQVEHPEDQTRTELRGTQQENLRLAREGVAKRLRTAEREHAAELGRWLQAERLYLEVQLNRDLDKVATTCWKEIDSLPQAVEEDAGFLQSQLDGILRDRYLTTLANLAVRRTAQAGDVRRLLEHVDAAIAAVKASDDETTDAAFGWKLFKYQLLVALDRPEELEAALQDWTGLADADNFWRRSLAYVAAEQGRIQEAIDLFERIEADDELIASDYRALAGWYLVAGERYAQERALVESFKAMEEWRMNDWLYQRLRLWQRNDDSIPEELDKDVLRMFAALFQKSANPQNYEWRLRQFYRATRDFRLLAGLADAVIGHTAGQVYPFLQRLSSTLEEVRDEATADSIMQQLAEVRTRAKTDIDLRALDLLELLVERRSSEVLNQPGPHVDRALAALQRAFRREEWSEGEPRLMADLLASLGAMTQKPLADEQVRQLQVLHGQSESGSVDRLHIGHALARAHWNYARHDRAIDLLVAALAEYQQACNGILPTEARIPLDTLVGYFESRGHYARGERTLLDQLKHPINRQQTHWLRQRLYRLYDNALSSGGDVSLGSGQLLYDSVTAQIGKELDTDDHNHRYQLVDRLCAIYRTAKRKEMDGVIGDLRTFAFERLPAILGMQTNKYQSTVSRVANTLEDLAGPRDGMELLIECIENEPSWFRLNRNDGWSQHAYQLADWRRQVGDKLGDLESRLLAIVIAELKRDLQARESRNQSMYHKHHGNYYWSEHAGDFARAAEEVYEQTRNSGAAVQYIADYMFWGVERHSRSIEMLLDAHNAELLDQQGQRKLVDFLHRRERYAESIPILLPLVERYPGGIQYAVWLMHAYFHGGRTSDLLTLLKTTDTYFHQENRWQERAMAALAKSCLDNHLFEQSTAYYEEVISLHQRTQPRRGIGNGTLSSYYSYLSQAYSGWKKTPEAVDAACGAIISWGPREDQRKVALATLKGVLRSTPDLDDYARQLDKQVADTGLDNAVVRKALGTIFFEKSEFNLAIKHLESACELQPNDTETHQQLVACYDKLGDQQGATRRLLESVKLSRRNIQLYKDLGGRYEKNEHPEQAERAFTSIVEALPSESEGHAMLAEIRQQQDRWTEAIEHWKRVARIRELEPTGLLKLAEAQMHQHDWDGARDTIKRLRARTWPERFGDIDSQIRTLERRIEQE